MNLPTIDDVSDMDNFYAAFRKASKSRRNKPEAFEFSKDLGMNLERLQEEIRNQTYQPLPPEEFTIRCKATGKERLIRAPHFRDQIVQHAIYKLTYGIFDKGFIHDSYGCRIGKGTLKAVDRAQSFMRESHSNSYYLQMDIKKFYYSIRHKILKFSIVRKLGEGNLLVDLMMKFCDSLLGVGLNIGNLLSQMYGLIYMDRLDHFIKRTLKQKFYLRYVDDFAIFGISDQRTAKGMMETIKHYIKNELDLEFSKWKIQKVRNGINFVGFRIWRRMRLVRKRVLRNFHRYLKRGDAIRISSLLEHSRRSSTFKTMIMALIKNGNYRLINKFHKTLRKQILDYKYM